MIFSSFLGKFCRRSGLSTFLRVKKRSQAWKKNRHPEPWPTKWSGTTWQELWSHGNRKTFKHPLVFCVVSPPHPVQNRPKGLEKPQRNFLGGNLSESNVGLFEVVQLTLKKAQEKTGFKPTNQQPESNTPTHHSGLGHLYLCPLHRNMNLLLRNPSCCCYRFILHLHAKKWNG